MNFPIAAETTPVAADADSDEAGWAPFAFLALAILALLCAVTFATMRFRSIRKRAKAPEPAAATTGGAAHAL
ncbi:hypothetical protein ACHMWU_05075 [Aeromicrobium sp. UC242_57]